MTGCLFCKIVTGDIPSEKVYEDNVAYAFLDIHPINPGHVLVVPKKHATNIFDTPDETLAHLAVVHKKIAKALKETLGAQGINVYANNEATAGQVIFHTHTHIIPRYKDDGRILWKGREEFAENNKELAEKIKNAL